MDDEVQHGKVFRTTTNPLEDVRVRLKLERQLRANQDFYLRVFVIDASIPRLTALEMYNNKNNLPLPVPTVRRVRATPRGFGGIVLRDGRPPEYASLGLDSDTWNNVKNECAINALIAYQRGTYGFKNLTRASIAEALSKDIDEPTTVSDIQEYAMMRSIPMYMVDGLGALVWKFTPDRNVEKQHKAFVCKINNGHMYPITDDKTKQEIIRGGQIKAPEIDWKQDHEYMGVLDSFDCNAAKQLDNGKNIQLIKNVKHLVQTQVGTRRPRST